MIYLSEGLTCIRTKLLVAFLFLLTSHQVLAAEIDFTRHLSLYPASYTKKAAEQQSVSEVRFFGVPGDARLIVSSPGNVVNATIQLNGVELIGTSNLARTEQVEVPVTLVDNNVMTVSLDTTVVHPFSIRVKQIADIELHVQSRIHFNTNVSDFPAAREFYGMLGFETLTGFPDTNTQAMARAIGVETPTDYDGAQGADAGGYLLHGELIGVNGFKGGMIDLIEFTVPRNDDPPYSKLNHLGMVSATMATTNIETDYEYMIEQGVQFLSSPTTRSDGTVFAVFTDLDGSFYELVGVDGDDDETETTHITSLSDLNINVSDFERSRAWYQMFGYDVTNKLPTTESMEVAKAIGFEQEIELDGALLTHNADGSTIKLVQWITPYDPEPAYPLPVNHFGLHRTAFTSTDIEADVATLKAQGVEFVSPITPCCSGPDSSSSIVAFYDPDGTIVELTEQPFLAQMLFPIFLWVRDTFL